MTVTDLPTPNIPLLRKAVEWAEAEAAKTDGPCMWYQRDWATQGECGTTYCIAGYAVTAALPNAQVRPTTDEDVDFAELRVDGEPANWMDVGAEVLGLAPGEAHDLFEETNTIADIRRAAENIAARAGDRL